MLPRAMPDQAIQHMPDTTTKADVDRAVNLATTGFLISVSLRNKYATSIQFFLLVVLLLLFAGAARAAVESDPKSDPQKTPVTTANPNVPLEDLRVMVKPLTKAELEAEAEAWFQLLRSKARQIAVLRLGVRKTAEAMAAEDTAEAEETLEAVKETAEKVEETAEQTEEEIKRAAQEEVGNETNTADENDQATETDEIDSADSQETPTDSAAEVKAELLADIHQLQDERTALIDRLQIVLDSLEEKGGDVEEYQRYSDAVSKVELETTDAEAAWSFLLGWLNSKEGGRRWAWNLGKFAAALVLAYLVAKFASLIVNWLLERKLKLSQLAEKLIANVTKYVLLLVGFAVALTALEVDVTPILAAFGAAGLVVGLALQNSLSNVASGLMILANRPFDVGDIVNAAGVTGTVQQMNLVSTTFRTFDNQTIHVPNNEIWNNVITNVTANPTRRVDLEFGVGYDDDFEQAERIIREVVDNHELVLDEPEPEVVTHALADSSVNIVCRPWVKTRDWWRAKNEITREVKRRFDAAGISIPFPQRDVHVHHHHDSA